MAIFPRLRFEELVQENDKTRLDASVSFISKDEAAISLVEIEPHTGDGFVDVTSTKTSDWFLDWVYTSAGTKTVSVRITTGGAPQTQTFDLEVVTEADDYLFSDDKDLIGYEKDILKWIKPGRDTWKDYHRKARDLVVKFFDDKGYIKTDGSKLVKDDFKDLDEVRQWSACLTLHLIFQNQSNAVDDIFQTKARFYDSKAIDFRTRSVFRLDLDGSGTIEYGENVVPTSVRMLRR